MFVLNNLMNSNQRFHLKDSLKGEKEEIELVENLIEEKKRELNITCISG